MTDVEYPPNLVQKIFAQEAPGGAPASVSVVAPTLTQPGQAFDVKICVLDAMGYPSTHCTEPVRIDGLPEVRFHEGQPAIARISDARLNAPGLQRLEARLGDHERFFSNPTLCTNGPATPIYWGDPHCHSALGYCMPATCRSLNYLFCAARYLSGLDWVAATDHVSNGRGDPGKWKDQCAVSELFHDPPAFVTLPAYEASFKGGSGGDHNVYLSRFPEMFIDDYEQGSIKTLCAQLRDRYPDIEFFVVPHHTTRAAKHGEISDEIYVGAEVSPVVEIHSKWGTSEYRGNPNALHKIHDGPSYIADFLNRGLRFGFVAGTDSHASMPGGRGVEPGHIDRLPGLTAVRADALSRQAIFDGIRGRHCYAASLERIYLDVTVSGAGPSRDIRVVAAGQSDITSIEVIRNGQVIDRRTPGCWTCDFTLRDTRSDVLASRHLGRFAYHYVRVTCASGAMAWSSPNWITLDDR